jgi:hypothetical protein
MNSAWPREPGIAPRVRRLVPVDPERWVQASFLLAAEDRRMLGISLVKRAAEKG